MPALRAVGRTRQDFTTSFRNVPHAKKHGHRDVLTAATETERFGGEGGIRTHGTLTRTAVFKTAAFNHSATSPASQRITPLRQEPLLCPVSESVARGGVFASIIAKSPFQSSQKMKFVNQSPECRYEKYAHGETRQNDR